MAQQYAAPNRFMIGNVHTRRTQNDAEQVPHIKSSTFPNRLAAFLYKFHAPLTYIISIVTHIHTHTNDVHNCTQKIFICLNLSCFVA